MSQILDAAYRVVHDYPGGAASLAPRLGHKSPITLNHELLRTGQAKLGLQTAVDITVLSKDCRILEAFAEQCGRFTLPMPAVLHEGGDHVLARLGDMLREQADVVREVTLAAGDGEYSLNERKRIVKEIGELVAAGSALLAALNGGAA